MKKVVNQRRRNRVSKKGQPPGAPIYLGDSKNHNVEVNLFSYTQSGFSGRKNVDMDKLPELPSTTNHWIDVNGIHDTELVAAISKKYGIHSLTLEDLVNTFQRPKCDEIDDYIFVIVKMVYLNDETADELDLVEEQVSFLLKDHLLISFQEKPGDVFDPIRDRIKNEESQLRRKGADYLLFLLLDIIVDHYLEVIERYEIVTREIEDEVMTQKVESTTINTIQVIKGHLGTLRRYVLPLREVVTKLVRTESDLIKFENKKYFNDVLDHIHQVTEQIDFLRDQNTSQREMHFTNMNLRMNKVMETLTIVTAIFIPLTFIVGVYGMNFDYMPELNMKYGYFAILAFMAFISILMIIYFRRKKWM
jgi:magnesium transporter